MKLIFENNFLLAARSPGRLTTVSLASLFALSLVFQTATSTFAAPRFQSQRNSANSISSPDSIISIELREDEIHSLETTIRIGQVANLKSTNSQLNKRLSGLDLDSFDDFEQQTDGRSEIANRSIAITKKQIQVRLMLAGISQDRLRISGPEQVVVIAQDVSNVRQAIGIRLRQQLAEQFVIAAEDIQVTLDERFSDFENGKFDFTDFRIVPTLSSDIPLGRQQITVLVQTQTGETVSRRIPVSIALIRDLVVAKSNISKGQTLSADNIESVRRPVVNRNIRFASFEQVVGKQVQNDIQQYELIKTNLIGNVRTRNDFILKKNSIVSVIARRGSLQVVLKDAKALESGNVGDHISLINAKTKERIMAKVIDASTAEVRF
jgi:flagella basal body P-ring formation protein FlgA